MITDRGSLFHGDERGLLDADPWETYEWHRAEAPLGYSSRRRAYFLFRYEDVRSAFASGEFTTEHPFRRSRRMFGRTMLDSDGDVHDRLRSLLIEPLKPSRVEGYRDDIIRPIVRQVLSELEGRERIDWLADVAEVVPIRVIAELIGLDCTTERLQAVLVPLADQIDHGQVASRRIEASRRELVALIDRAVLGSLANASPIGGALRVGVETGAITADEARDNAILLLVAASATTTSAIANTMWLTIGTDVYDAVARGLVSAGSVAQEALRIEPPLRFSPRFVRRDMTFAAGSIPAGSAVQLCVASANRDAGAYAKPDKFDPARLGEPPSLSFGRGVHSCIGAFVGLSEVTVVLEEAAARFPAVTLDNVPHFRPGWSFRRPHAVLSRVS